MEVTNFYNYGVMNEVEAGATQINNYYGKLAAEEERHVEDSDILAAVRLCQAEFWADSAWAVVYRILQSNYGEKRNVMQFEGDMFAKSEGLDYRCGKGCIAMGLQNNVVLRERPDAWKDKGAKARILLLKDAFVQALEGLLKA